MPLLGGGISAGEREKDLYGLGKNPCVLSIAQRISAGIPCVLMIAQHFSAGLSSYAISKN